MVWVETVSGSNKGHSRSYAGGVMVHFTDDETRQIAERADAVGGLVAALAPHYAVIIKGSAFLLSWKARSCRRKGKRLAVIIVGLIPIPTEDLD